MQGRAAHLSLQHGEGTEHRSITCPRMMLCLTCKTTNHSLHMPIVTEA